MQGVFNQSLSPNQTKQSNVQGTLDLHFNPSTISAQVHSTEADELVPGQAVKVVDVKAGVPHVVSCAADSDDVFGFINYTFKQTKFVAGAALELSVLAGNVMYMTAKEALAPWVPVMIVPAETKVAAAAGGATIVGRTLDKAVGDGSLVRVAISLPGSPA